MPRVNRSQPPKVWVHLRTPWPQGSRRPWAWARPALPTLIDHAWSHGLTAAGRVLKALGSRRSVPYLWSMMVEWEQGQGSFPKSKEWSNRWSQSMQLFGSSFLVHNGISRSKSHRTGIFFIPIIIVIIKYKRDWYKMLHLGFRSQSHGQNTGETW